MGASEYLEHNLPTSLRRKLVRSLNTDDRWNRIIEGLHGMGIFLDIDNMNDLVRRGRTSPADWVLDEMIDRNCSLDVFCFVLREFDLLEELSFMIPPEPIVIEVQPGPGNEEDVNIRNGAELQLTCIATGIPRPTYQWYQDNTPIPGQQNSHLSIAAFSEENIGVYWCAVCQDLSGFESVVRSQEVQVDLLAERPVLLKDLQEMCTVARGKPLRLEVQAEAYPHPCYEWYRVLDDGTFHILPDHTSNIFQLAESTPEDEGVYMCSAYNKAGATVSTRCTFSIFEIPPGHSASAKVALLIANENYYDEKLQGLRAPTIDVETLAGILTKLGFHVIALHNLTYTEMGLAFKWFRSILPQNAYAFFYFAGHGCSKLSSNCVMPIDCPGEKFELSNVWCDEEIKQIFSNGKPLQLLVMLFDCCRQEASDLSIGSTKFEHDFGNCNVFVGTATRNYSSAFEIVGENSNGLFVNRLKDHLADEKAIVDILQANLKEFKNKQQEPTLLIAGYGSHSLRDPVEDDERNESIHTEVDFEYQGEEEIHFSRTNEKFVIKLQISKHKNCFLNSVDLEFPPEFDHNFTVQVNSKDIKLTVENKTVTIHNIQRIKVQPLCVTVILNGLRLVDSGLVSGPLDSYTFDLHIPAVLHRRLASWTDDCTDCLLSTKTI